MSDHVARVNPQFMKHMSILVIDLQLPPHDVVLRSE